ncbi:OmpA family protein [Paraburkholderia sp. LEh10]|jgi:outer membrane protein OmpA-like peptidoglycan-associated protein|uniref:OmpA family protein n=1 Tax=Paraburkholderia sp. LEh10 TaxID=2821353 RepID=UPI001AE8EDD8|nr:OmpA family protein [Paraburkholderia sp. LEh10]MBP0593969.1 OmpA family protein [Paraburkholderia sp. LEh10]
MSGSIISILNARRARGALLVTLCVIACARVAHAAEPVLKEQDIDEQSVTRALAPEDNGDNIVTRGFVLSNKQPGAAAKPAGPARHPSLQMLITFTTNSSTLTQSAQTALDKVAHALQSEQLAAFRFRVEGHADPRGSAESNMKLSEDRAAAVVAYLTQKDGIAPERLSSVGKGSTEPLNRRNPTAPENRRVTIVTVTD